MYYSRGLAGPNPGTAATSSIHKDATPFVVPGITGAKPIVLDSPTAYHMPNWEKMTDPQRLAVLRGLAEQRGRDPRIRQLAFEILRQSKVDQRQYEKQAAALLKYVQERIAYVNEPGEQIQDPLLTLRLRAGDCDDMAILLAALYEAVRLPWRYVLSGAATSPGSKPVRCRWIEGTPLPAGFRAGHIYVTVGWPPFAPPDKVTWTWAEPTIKGKPLGWDVTGELERRGTSSLPELAGPSLSGSASGAAGGAVAAGVVEGGKRIQWETVLAAVIVGSLTAVAATGLTNWMLRRGIIPTAPPPRP